MAVTNNRFKVEATPAPSAARKTVWVVTVEMGGETLPITKVFAKQTDAIATALLMEEGSPVQTRVTETPVIGGD